MTWYRTLNVGIKYDEGKIEPLVIGEFFQENGFIWYENGSKTRVIKAASYDVPTVPRILTILSKYNFGFSLGKIATPNVRKVKTHCLWLQVHHTFMIGTFLTVMKRLFRFGSLYLYSRLEKSKSVTAKFVLRFRSLSGSLIDAICQIECVLDMHMVFESLFFLKSTHFLFEQQ